MALYRSLKDIGQVALISAILLREAISRETLPKKTNHQSKSEGGDDLTTFRIPVSIPVNVQ